MAFSENIHNDGSKDIETAAVWVAEMAYYLTRGSQIIDINVDNNAVNMSRIYIAPAFTGEFGTVASPVIAEVSNTTPTEIDVAAFYYLASAGSAAYKAGAGVTKLCDVMVQDGDNLMQFLDGKILQYELNRGTLDAANAGAITTFIQNGGSSHLKTSGSAAVITALTVEGGSCRMERQTTTAIVRGGTLIVDAKTELQGTLKVEGNGKLWLKESGTITSFSATGGMLIVELGRPVVITNSTLDLSVPGVKDLWQLKDSLVTFSNEPTWQGGVRK